MLSIQNLTVFDLISTKLTRRCCAAYRDDAQECREGEQQTNCDLLVGQQHDNNNTNNKKKKTRFSAGWISRVSRGPQKSIPPYEAANETTADTAPITISNSKTNKLKEFTISDFHKV